MASSNNLVDLEAMFFKKGQRKERRVPEDEQPAKLIDVDEEEDEDEDVEKDDGKADADTVPTKRRKRSDSAHDRRKKKFTAEQKTVYNGKHASDEKFW